MPTGASASVEGRLDGVAELRSCPIVSGLIAAKTQSSCDFDPRASSKTTLSMTLQARQSTITQHVGSFSRSLHSAPTMAKEVDDAIRQLVCKCGWIQKTRSEQPMIRMSRTAN